MVATHLWTCGSWICGSVDRHYVNLFSVHLSQGNLEPLGQCLDRPRAFVLIILPLSLQKPEATVKQMLLLFSFCFIILLLLLKRMFTNSTS